MMDRPHWAVVVVVVPFRAAAMEEWPVVLLWGQRGPVGYLARRSGDNGGRALASAGPILVGSPVSPEGPQSDFIYHTWVQPATERQQRRRASETLNCRACHSIQLVTNGVAKGLALRNEKFC